MYTVYKLEHFFIFFEITTLILRKLLLFLMCPLCKPLVSFILPTFCGQ